MSEIRVRLYREINDYCNELWETIDSPKRYFNRMYHNGIEEWLTSSDAPNGYCESDCSVSTNVVFVICDHKGNEIARAGNGNFERKEIMRSIHEELKFQFGEYQKQCDAETESTDISFSSWLLSFMTPELCEKNGLEYSNNCTEDNWLWFWNDTISSEKVYEFQRLGQKYVIAKETIKHRFADIQWFGYVIYLESEFKKLVNEEFRSGWLLSKDYDSSIVGEMLSSSDASEIIENALKDIYQINDYRIDKLHYVYAPGGFTYERKLELRQAASIIMPKERYKTKVQEAIENERNNHTFFTNWKDVKEKYPNCKQDHSF